MENNKLVENFIKDNNFDEENIEAIKNSSLEEVNPVVYRYGLYKNSIKKDVCVADIIGNKVSRTNSENILKELNELFADVKIGYRSRCNSMLNYNSGNIIEKLKDSFSKDPINLCEFENGKYLVNDNGRHRCLILRVHYLNELSKCISNQSKRELKHKYTIPAQVEELDIVKTYSKYLISLEKIGVGTKEELDDNYLKTGKMIVIDEDGNKKVTQIMNLFNS